MRRSRQILAVVILTSALAADGTLLAAPVREAAASTTFAGRLVRKLSDGLQRTMTARPFLAAQRSGFAAVTRVSAIRPSDSAAVDISPRPLSPFQFRLPPPAAATFAIA